MSELVSHKQVNTRKEHRCIVCDELIPVGDVADVFVSRFDGKILRHYQHPKCTKVYTEMCLKFKDSAVDMEDAVWRYYQDHLSANIPEEDWMKLSFKEQIDYICAKINNYYDKEIMW